MGRNIKWLGLSATSILLAAAVGCSSASGDGSGIGSGGTSSGGTNSGGGPAGGQGGGLIGGTGGIGTGNTGGGNDCGGDSYSGELLPVALYLLQDRSGSMQGMDGDKWTPVTGAIRDFVDIPTAGVSMGLGFFPTPPAVAPPSNPCTGPGTCGDYECTPIFNTCSGFLSPNDSCVGSDYAKPTVEIQPLPGVAQAIKSGLTGTSPDGSSTPIGPAMEGAITYITSYSQQNPDQVPVIILASDGEPNNCAVNRVETVAARAQQAYQGNPSILTFVIGIGNLSVLDQIAAAGGTDKAIIVSGSNAGQDFLDALNEIRGAVGCQFKMPKPDTGGDADPTKINVYVTQPGGMKELVPNVGNAASCAGGAGWYYDNPAAPTRILTCPSTCDVITNVAGTIVDVSVGCDTVVK